MIAFCFRISIKMLSFPNPDPREREREGGEDIRQGELS